MSDTIHVLGKRLHLKQIPDGFRTSIDSILLASACPAKEGESILDLGCGVGSAGLCVLYRVPDTKLTGIDILKDHVELVSENAALNHKDARSTFLTEDIRDYEVTLQEGHKGFDHIICNPPYLEGGSHIPSPKAHKQLAIGHGEDDLDLKDWIDSAFRNLRSGGSFTTINRADATDKIIREMGKRFGAIEIFPLWPKQGIQAKRIIIRAIKNRKTPATMHPGLIVHDEDGEYTDAANKVLKDVQALF